MSRIRKKHLGVIPGVLALLALCVAWMVPLMPAQAEDGRSATAESYCDDNGNPVLHFVLTGYPEVTQDTDVNNVNVTVDGEFKPAYSGGFTGPGTYEDFVPLGDPTISHSWKVEVDAYDGDHGDTTLTGSSEPCTSPDGDGDGVPDDQDQCPGTPAGDVADANGCSSSQLDSDGDGVNDNVDQCPNQPGPADNGGCPVVEPPADSDGDGVPNDTDQCAGTPSGEPVDANGCSDSQKDSDNDGVNDADDQCPGTPPGTDVDANGCAIVEPPADSDGDGVNDDKDECPGTPPGTQVDNKGCPVGNDNPGNNGTIKVDGAEFDSHPDNQPHVGCTFQVDFYGYGQDVGNATVSFELQSPTVDGRTLTVTSGDLTPDIGEDPPGGGTDLDASETYTLAFTGEPHVQGYHVKLTVNAPDSKGNDVKHKVFWVDGCEPDEEEPSGSSDFVVNCESLVINEPKDVMPEDSEYQYFLDGEAIEVGSHELAPGDYTLTLEVDGTEVDSDTFTVEECDDEPPVSGESKFVVDCESVTIEEPTVSPEDSAYTYYLDNEEVSVGTHALTPGEHTLLLVVGREQVDSDTFTVEECDDEPPVVDYDYTVSPNQGSCKVRVPKADVTTEFDSSIGYQLKGEEDVVWQHREVSAGDYVVTLPKVGKGDSVVYRVVIQPLDDTADRLTSDSFRFSVPANCGGNDTPDNPDNPDTPDTPDQPDTPEYGVPDTGAPLMGSQDSGNGWPFALFAAGGLVALALTRWGRKIKVMSR